MKWAGAVLVMVSAGCLGFYGGHVLTRRTEQMRAVQKIVYLLRGEIRYSLSKLPEIFEGLSRKAEPPFDSFLGTVAGRLDRMDGATMAEIWREELEACRNALSLRAEERQALEELGTGLGYLDKEMQLQLIGLFLSKWETGLAEAEKNAEKDCRLYRYLGVLGGLVLTVMLI